MFIRISFFVILLFAINLSVTAQILDIAEKTPVSENGIEYSYVIKNEQVKTSRGEEYSRYEISFYVSNKSGCTKLYRNSTNTSESANLLVTFNCINANGKRFTSKNAAVRAKDFYVNAKRTVDGKESIESVKAGYIFRNGETLNSNIIVLVPKGERPVIQVVVNYLPELQ